MKKETFAKFIVPLGMAVVAAVAFAILWTARHYVIVDWMLYPKDVQILDLRGQELTRNSYTKLTKKLPGRTIYWNVPFQDTCYPSDTRQITVSALTDADVACLDYFPWLETVHGEQCQDYPQLMALQQRRPECEVLYQVPIGGKAYPQNARKVTAPSLTAQEAQLLAYLPELTVVDASGCRDYAMLMALQQSHPQWEVVYTVSICGETYPEDTRELTVSGAAYEELHRELAGLPQLEQLYLIDPASDGESLLRLREEFPQIDIHWQLDVFGQTVADDAVELDISGVPLESTEQAEQIAAYFPQLEKLIMSDCGIDNEAMAAFRERRREDYKVVWTVYFSTKSKARTDETYFMPIKQGEYYFQEKHVYNLRYCEDMVCIDLGHSRISTIDFVAYMPHLKYLILADTSVRDLTPISSCKELIYLELGWCNILDYTPLLGCTALEDLNIGRTFADPEPITHMTWLKNLWWMESSYKTQEMIRSALPDTYLEYRGTDVVAYGWRRLPNYYAMRDYLGMPYMD